MDEQKGAVSTGLSEAVLMHQGLEAIFFENRDALIRFLRARGAADQAEDLVQEVWLRVTAQRNGPIANPRSYLFRAAHNLMVDIHRADTQRSQREQNWSEARGDLDPVISDEPSAERRVIAQAMLDRANQTLEELGEPTITIFRRFRIEGVAQKIIARDLAVSLATVEKHLQKAYRAMAALKKEFDTE